MKAAFDLEGLVRDLEASRDGVAFRLTNEPPVPPDVAEPLWKAHGTVVSVLESLRGQCDPPESGWTIYAPEGW